MTPSFSKKEAFSYGWHTMQKHFWLFVQALAVIILITGIIGFVASLARRNDFVLLNGLLQVLNIIIGTLLGSGFIAFALKIYRGQEASVGDLFSQGDILWHYLLATILYSIIVAVGFLLLIVPGVIFLLKYQFVSYCIVDKRMGVKDAFKESAVMTKGEKGNLFWFGILSLLLYIAGVMVFFVGIVVTIPMVIMGYVFVYHALSKKIELTAEHTQVLPAVES